MSFFRRFLLVALGVLLHGALGAQDISPQELAGRLQEAVDLGDSRALAQLAQPYRAPAPVPVELPARTLILLGIALHQDPAMRAAELFEAARQDPVEYVRATWWLVETMLRREDIGQARRFTQALRDQDPASPVVAYLTARIALVQHRLTPRTYRPRRTALETEIAGALAAGLSPQARQHPDFNPRFLTAATDYALERNDLAAAGATYAELLRERGRNRDLARHTMSLRLFEPGDHAALLTAAARALPAEEVERWRARAAALAGASDEASAARREVLVQLAEEAATSPDLAAFQSFFVQRAVAALAQTWQPWREARSVGKAPPAGGDPRFPALAARFATLAAGQAMGERARAALDWLDLAAEVSTEFRPDPDAQLALARRAADFDRALTLLPALLPANATNYAWLRGYWRIIETGPLGLQQQAVKHLVALKPEEPFVLRVAAHFSREPLAAYETFFALKPARGTEAIDWSRYRELLKDAEASRGFLDAAGKAPGASAPTAGADARGEQRFAATLQRWQEALPNDPVVAEQVALLALERLIAQNTRENVLAAYRDVGQARMLGSTHKKIQESWPLLAQVKSSDAGAQKDGPARPVAPPPAKVAGKSESDLAIAAAREKAARAREQGEKREELARHSERIRKRGEYIRELTTEQAALAYDLDNGKLTGSARQAARKRYEAIAAEAKAFCKACKALGGYLEGDRPMTCTVCNGLGHR